MKTKYLLLAAAMTIAMVLLRYTAHAQEAYLGPELGIYHAHDADHAQMTGGGALRLRLTPGLGVEGSITYRKEDYAGGRVSVGSWPVMLTGLIYPLPMVYGAIGMGWYNTRISYNGALLGQTIPSASQQKFGWHFGAGAEVPIGPNMKLIGDIRYVFLNYDFKQVPGSSGMSANFYVVSAGLLFEI